MMNFFAAIGVCYLLTALWGFNKAAAIAVGTILLVVWGFIRWMARMEDKALRDLRHAMAIANAQFQALEDVELPPEAVQRIQASFVQTMANLERELYPNAPRQPTEPTGPPKKRVINAETVKFHPIDEERGKL